MNEKYTFDFIEEYLAGTLPPEELESFEQALKTDDQLAKELEEQKAAHHAVALYTQIKTRENVSDLYEKVKGKGEARVRKLGPIALAATVVFLVLMGLAYFFVSNAYSGSNLVANYLEPYPDRITSMSGSPSTDLSEAMEAYNLKDYASAIPLFGSVSNENNYYPLSQLYLGISRLETGNAIEAEKVLNTLYQQDTNVKETALWYLALAQLSAGNESSAKDNLQKIVNEGSFQSAKAENLLKKMNSPLRGLPGVR